MWKKNIKYFSEGKNKRRRKEEGSDHRKSQKKENQPQKETDRTRVVVERRKEGEENIRPEVTIVYRSEKKDREKE